MYIEAEQEMRRPMILKVRMLKLVSMSVYMAQSLLINGGGLALFRGVRLQLFDMSKWLVPDSKKKLTFHSMNMDVDHLYRIKN